ncbi:MAG: NAD(P)-binding domain-containing protein [Bradyrhizobiaceae bacterium]|nr:NAD(P)-binding domain-containing protein [Bradyrhizobiaceae bacterium]
MSRASRTQSGRSICVIGAGPCGLTAVKNLLAVSLNEVVCYDESDSIAGTWAFDEHADRTTVYESTHIISSKSLSGFEDYPMPAAYPDFPSHRQMRVYFEDYAAHFGLLPFIRLQTRVEKACLRPDGRWSIGLTQPQGSTEEVFDHLIICSGHLREPSIPAYPGTFTGEALHSRSFKHAEPFRDKRVLVVGGGNSACDIAVDVSRVAARTCISMRRGYYIVPKIMFGRPVDVLYARLRRRSWWLPRSAIRGLMTGLLRLGIGPSEKYGLQKPKSRLFEMHPTLNTNILSALRDGTVLPRVGIAKFDGPLIHFQDGVAEPFDAIIWATGFNISFPFLDASVVDWDRSCPPPLYLKMMHRRIANLFFLGLFQPIGCIWRLADHQARIAALQIAGRWQRPNDIDARVERENVSRHWQFDQTPRHAVEVDYHDFRRELFYELARARA